jgi:hypothetical protein
MSVKTLWTDDKTTEDIEYFSKEDSYNVIYNLQEDILCLKERIAELEKDKDELNIQIEVLKHSDAEYYGLYSELLFSPNEPPESLEAHNLKQHSLAVNNFANKFCGDATTNYQVQLTIDAHCWCEMLDSKALKDGK